MTIYEKIKEARLKLGLNQSDFSNELGLLQKDVSKIENGQRKFIPNRYFEYFFEKGFDINSFYNDNLPLFKRSDSDDQAVSESVNDYSRRFDKRQKNQTIPLYNLEATAGLVELFAHYNEKIPMDYISIPNLPKCDGAVFVTGDSMYPLLKSGDIVIYKMIMNIEDNLFWGEMYLISVAFDDEEYVSVKYVQKSDLGDHYIKLVSQNGHHQSKDVRKDRIRALAMVKASIRINNMT